MRMHALKTSPAKRASILAKTQWQVGREELLYWGFSYATVIGATFAALYPTQVGRMVLDGVVDAPDYYHGGWRSGLHDADAVLDSLVALCADTGSSRWFFCSEGDIISELVVVVDSLKQAPLAVEGNHHRGPDIITYSDLIILTREALYRPLQRFAQLADVLAGLSQGNGSLFADLKHVQRRLVFNQQPSHKPYDQLIYDGLYGISCSDNIDVSNFIKEDFREYVGDLQNQSRWSASVWAEFLLPC